ncbi:MAG: putative spermidine/putrescine transport system substrate-binding protein [Solirubrobacteraceae bacterium]|nr:putative spermidine/putrescine transport system substrate-binding protein [Solirubrobacteraceae bacterium]
MHKISRRSLIAAMAATVAVGLAACGSPETKTQPSSKASEGPADLTSAPALPAKPIKLNVIDGGGDLQLSQPAIDEFVKDNPKLVDKVTYSKSTGPELAGKIQAGQRAGKVQYNLVVAGYGEIATGAQQGLWQKLLPNFAKTLGDVESKYQEGALKMFKQVDGFALTSYYNPNGPLLEYNPAKVSKPPTTAQQLLAWAKANPKKFTYARPANSGPGRTLLMGLPYILGDSDPRDPDKGWSKTWAFLKDLDEYIDHYPSATGVTMDELTSGAVNMIASTTGWDVNPRALGVVPKEFKIQPFDGFHFVADAHYMAIPRGVPEGEQAVILELMKFMLTPRAQAYAYDKGYFYPGPAVKDVPLSLAPAGSQKVVKEYARPEYDKLFKTIPVETQLDPDDIVYMFDRWDREVGGSKVKE